MRNELSRRKFLQTAVAAAAATHLPITRLEAAAASPTIIDTHTHFYDPTRAQGVPWPPREDELLYRTVLPRDYRALVTPLPVAGTVVVEASSWIGDNQWILDLADRDPFIVGFVGNLPAGTAEFAGHLKRLTRHRLFRGIRIGGGRLKEGLSDGKFLRDLKLLEKQDLALDVLGGPDILPDTARLARELPRLRIIIDHVANVRIDGKQPPDGWLRGIDGAANHARVCCKVSGLVEGTGRTDGTAPKDAAFYLPVLDRVWEAFGEERLIYGSNWPVSERFAPLATVQTIVADYFAGKDRRATARVFSENARQVYKWVTR